MQCPAKPSLPNTAPHASSGVNPFVQAVGNNSAAAQAARLRIRKMPATSNGPMRISGSNGKSSSFSLSHRSSKHEDKSLLRNTLKCEL